MAVGIFDSGLGGLTVLSAAQTRLPDVDFLYYADSAHAPYGVRDAEDIYQLTRKAVQSLWDRGCNLVILACNTASAAALRRMQEEGVPEGKRVLGVFVPLIEALTERQWGDNSPPREVAVKHVALFATPATVSSRAFQRELAFRAIGVDVEAQACGGVVDAIEDGDMIWPRRWCAAMWKPSSARCLNRRRLYWAVRITRLWLTCFRRHWDLTYRSIAGELVAESLADYLHRHPNMLGNGPGGFLTTGKPNVVSDRATQFLRRQITFEAA